MDALDVLRKAEELGGAERKKSILHILTYARSLGCEYSTGGGKVGGFNIRYGSLKYAVMDVNTQGTLFLHIKPHPGKPISDELRIKSNEFINSLAGVEIKNGPIHHYGQVDAVVELIPPESVESFLDYSINTIQELYY